MKKRMCLLFLGCMAGFARAEMGLVREYVETNGVPQCISETPTAIGANYETGTSPSYAGYIFTHWTMNVEGATRDELGRAYERQPYHLANRIDLTAHYLPANQDSDNDGVADAYEIYWYGNLGQGADSDTDGDGFTFAEELKNGTNPLIADGEVAGPIVYADGEMTLYNPNGYAQFTISSETEGLVTPVDETCRPGTSVSTPTLSPTSSKFAYWTRNGEPVRDELGRAIDGITLTIGEAVENFVAVGVADYDTRMKLYWYGDESVAMDSDTDGDGFTFAQELKNGTNPLMADGDVEGPVLFADGELILYNPFDYKQVVITTRTGDNVQSNSCEYLRPGTVVETENKSPTSSQFAYWTRNGVPCRDELGRAIDRISFSMGTVVEELEAVQIADADTRQKLYWYGTTDVAMDSDTDGDGFTFAQELKNGTNPLMADGEVEGPVQVADGRLLLYDPNGKLDTCVATAAEYAGVYDGRPHGISVTVLRPTSGYTLRYGLSDSGPFSATMPTLKDVGNWTVWYEVAAVNYETLVECASVVISAKALTEQMVGTIDDVDETGAEVTPKPTVADGTVVLVEGRDYTLDYADNVLPGTARVTVNGKGNYAGSVVRTFTIRSSAGEKLKEIFDGIGEVTKDDDGWKVTVTNDVVGTIEIPDDIGPFFLDLNGHDLRGASGDAESGSYDGEPAIVFVHVDGGEGTSMVVRNSDPEGRGGILGGDGADGTAEHPAGGNGAPGILIEDAAVAPSVTIGENVLVRGGRGGDGYAGSGADGGNGGAGIEDRTAEPDDSTIVNGGTIEGGDGGNGADGTGDTPGGNGGNGGAGVDGDVDVNTGTITGGNGGDGGDSESGNGGNGGDGGDGVSGDVGTNEGTITGGDGGNGGSSDSGDGGEGGNGGSGVGGDVGDNTGTITDGEDGATVLTPTMVSLAEGPWVYARAATEPAVTVTSGSSALVKGVDFTVQYQNNVNAGRATVQITGIGKCEGTVTKTFDISPKPLAVIADAKTQVYGETAKPLTYTTDGLIVGDALTGALTREPGEDVGEYDILQGTLANANYTISYTGAKYTIVKRVLPPEIDPDPIDPGVDPDDPGQRDDPTIPFSKFDYVGVYDGEAHTIDTDALKAAYAAALGAEVACMYARAQDGEWAAEPPAFKDAVVTSFWYKVTTANYGDVVHPCKVVITKRPVTVTSGTKLDFVYDGKPHQFPVLIKSESWFVAGEGITTSNWATVTEVAEGQVANTFDYAPIAGTKLENYDITVVTGKIAVVKGILPPEIDPDPIDPGVDPDDPEQRDDPTIPFSKLDYVGVYDGEAHTIDADALKAAYEAALGTEVACMYARAQDGEWAAEPPTFKDAVVTSFWYKVTSANFADIVKPCKVVITKRPVTVTSGTKLDFVYDGKPHQLPVLIKSESWFIAGEGITTSNWAMVTEVAEGQVANTFDYAPLAGTKLENYDFTVVTGKIAVVKGILPPEVDPDPIDPSVDPDDPEQRDDPMIPFSKFDYVGVYDGEAHTIDTDALKASYGAALGAEVACMYARAQDGEWAAEPPTFKDAVVTSFWYKVTSANYGDVVHPCKEVITKRPVTVTSGTKLDFAYDGKPHQLPVLIKSESWFVMGEGIATSNWATVTEVAEGQVANTFDYAPIAGTKLENYDLTVVTGKIAVVKGILPPEVDPDPIDPSVDPDDPEQRDDPTIPFSKFDYVGVHDGEAHTIDTDALKTAYGAALGDCSFAYARAREGEWAAEPPTFKDTVVTSFWYKVTSANYGDVVHPCKVVITNRCVTLTSGTQQFVYDGNAHSNTSVTVGGAGFVPGEGVGVRDFATITDVGERPNAFAYDFNAGTRAANYAVACVTGVLKVVSSWIDPDPIDPDIDPDDPADIDDPTRPFSKFDYLGVYDGEAHTIDTEGLKAAYGAALGDCSFAYARAREGEWSAEPPAFRDAGATALWYRVRVAGLPDIVHPCKVTILRRHVTLTSGTEQFAYDGSAHSNATVTVGGMGFAPGEGVTGRDFATITEVGEASNAFSYDFNEGTRAANYTVTCRKGWLTVVKRPIDPEDRPDPFNPGVDPDDPGDVEDPEAVFSEFDYAGVYDGEAHTIDADALKRAYAAVVGEGLSLAYRIGREGRWTAEPPAFRDAGAYVIWYRVTSPHHQDVVHPCRVLIAPRDVTLASPTKEKAYDGTPLTFGADEMSVSGTGFAEGEAFVYSDFAALVDEGEKEATFSYAGAEGTRVANYAVTVLNGVLKVTESPGPVVTDWEMAPTPSSRGGYAFVEDFVMSVTNPPNVIFDVSAEQWRLGFVVRWPTGPGRNTAPAEARFRLSTQDREYACADVLAGDTGGELLKAATNRFGFVTSVTWEVLVTPEDLERAHDEGLLDLAFAMTARADASPARPDGLAPRDFTLAMPLGNEALYDCNGYRVYPRHCHEWSFAASQGYRLGATCASDGSSEPNCPCPKTVYLSIGASARSRYLYTGNPVSFELGGEYDFRWQTGALVGGIVYRQGGVRLDSAPVLPGDYTAEVRVIPMAAAPVWLVKEFTIVGFGAGSPSPELAAWASRKGLSSAALAGSRYVQSSFELGTTLLDGATLRLAGFSVGESDVRFRIEAVKGGRVEVARMPAAGAAEYIRVASDLGSGFEGQLPAAGVRVDAETGEIAIPRAALGSGACLRVVVPADGGN